MKKLQPYAPAIAWGIFIFVLSVWPGKDFPKPDWGDLLSLDKLVHITFYALLTGLILRGYLLSGKEKVVSGNTLKASDNRAEMVRFAVMTAISCTAYGWLLEWIQENFCQDRLFDWFDGLANTIGASLALGVFIWRSRK
jgi:VanZ family protein